MLFFLVRLVFLPTHQFACIDYQKAKSVAVPALDISPLPPHLNVDAQLTVYFIDLLPGVQTNTLLTCPVSLFIHDFLL